MALARAARIAAHVTLSASKGETGIRNFVHLPVPPQPQRPVPKPRHPLPDLPKMSARLGVFAPWRLPQRTPAVDPGRSQGPHKKLRPYAIGLPPERPPSPPQRGPNLACQGPPGGAGAASPGGLRWPSWDEADHADSATARQNSVHLPESPRPQEPVPKPRPPPVPKPPPPPSHLLPQAHGGSRGDTSPGGSIASDYTNDEYRYTNDEYTPSNLQEWDTDEEGQWHFDDWQYSDYS